MERFILVCIIIIAAGLFCDYKTEIICNGNTSICSLYKTSIIYGKREETKISIDKAKKLVCYKDERRYRKSRTRYKLKFADNRKTIYSYMTREGCNENKVDIINKINAMPQKGETTVYSKIFY